jgi:hypothetical protein
MRSVMEAMQNDPTYKPNFESLEDSAKDLINYASFFVAYSRGKVDGQKADRDFVNRKIDTTKNVNPVLYDSMDNYGGALGFIGETGSSGRVGVVGSTAHWGNAFGANGGTER